MLQWLLHIGSSLTLLFQFRENRVVLVWDIDKVFLNVEVGPWDKDCLHFLWMEEPPDLSQVVVYTFCRVPFKQNASLLLLNAKASCQTVWNIWSKVSKVALTLWFCQGWSDITGRLIELHKESAGVCDPSPVTPVQYQWVPKWYSKRPVSEVQLGQAARGGVTKGVD